MLKNTFALIALVMVLINGCTDVQPNQSPVPIVTPLEARDIASSQIPQDVLAKGFHNSTQYIDPLWHIVFVIPAGTNSQSLGWRQGPGTVLENTGELPQDTFVEIQFEIDGATGNVLLKKATDHRTLIQPGPEITLGPVNEEQPLWQYMIVVSVGLLIAALLVRLIANQRTRRI